MLHQSCRYTCVRFLVLFISIASISGWTVFRSHSHPASARHADRSNKAASPNNPSGAADKAGRAGLSKAYGKLPLDFEANEGQASDSVRFMSHGAGFSLFLEANDATLVMRKSASSQTNTPHSDLNTTQQESAIVRMRMIAARPSPEVSGENQAPGKSNYFIGNDPSKWRTSVPNYRQVRYREIYPGVDLVYHSNQRQLEYDFVVAPHANPRAIKLQFDGVRHLSIDGNGDLILKTPSGDIRELKPLIYQETDGGRRIIDGRYIASNRRVSFEIGAYDESRQLLIDPTLVYSTYLGGGADDVGRGIAVDAGGNAYVTGYTYSTNFPVSAGALQSTNQAPYNAFVTKLDPTGSVIIYSTYLGGSGSGFYNDEGSGIRVDAAGNAYVAGVTNSANFPVTAGAFQTTFAGGGFTGCCFPGDGFVTKLNPTGSALIYSTYLGGSGWDLVQGIDIDATGSAYVAGQTHSLNFPVTAGAFQTSFHGSSGCGGNTNSAFVTKLNPSGTGLVYSTYLGGSGFDSALGIAVDATGNAYVTGFALSSDFPTTAGAFQSVKPGPVCNNDGFVTKLNANGSGLVYSSYLGGSTGQGSFNGVAVDSAGDAYVAGSWNASGFPITVGAIQTTYGGGGTDAFVTAMNPSGSGLVYSTYLGGNGDDSALSLALDSSRNVYVTGTSSSTNFPTTSGALSTTFQGARDVFLSQIDPAGSSLLYSSYLGGSGDDYANSVSVDATGGVYLTGATGSTNFATTPGAVQTINHGGSDAFIAKIGGLACGAPVWTTKASMPTPVVEAAGVAFNGKFYVIDGATGSGISAPQVYDPSTDSWSFTSPDPVSRAETSAGVIGNKIYVAEGWLNSDSNSPANALAIYDPTTNSWTPGAPSILARGGSASAVIGTNLYVAGGSKFGNSFKFNDLEIYDSLTNSWSTGAPMPMAIEYAAGAAINGKFYVVGGDYGPTNANNTISNLLFIYDPVTNSWTSGAPMPTPRDVPAAAVIDGKLYVVGGNNGSGSVAILEIYDPLANSWSTGPSAPTARQILVAGAINSNLYVTGGYNSSSTIDGTLDVFGPSCAATPTPTPTATPTPTPTPSADLSLTKTASPSGNVAMGAQINYTIVVSNSGPDAAANVTVDDATPAGTVFSSVTTSQGSCSSPAPLTSGNVHCTLGNVSSANSATINLAVYVITLPVSNIHNTATASTSTFDPNPNNNSASTDNSVVGCNLVVTNTNDSGLGSLRLAMQCANANPGPDTITFAIPAPGVQTITPLSPLPVIAGPLVIDGYSQTGAAANTQATNDNAVLLVELNGSSAGGGTNAFMVAPSGSGSSLRGLVINRFSGNGIVLNGSSNNHVEGNFIGTDAAGLTALGNGVGVLASGGSGNVIGGASNAARNLVSGNAFGITVSNSATNNTVQGNFVGTDGSGAAPLGNNGRGIGIINGASANQILANVVSGNGAVGIAMVGSNGNVVQGNLVGTNAAGTNAVPNQGNAGVRITSGSQNNLIGGPSNSARNLVSGNTNHGIHLDSVGTSGNSVQGNYVGTDVSGTAAIPNGIGSPNGGADGLRIDQGATNNLVGGSGPGAGNVISGNNGHGVHIDDFPPDTEHLGTANNTVQGNYIGTDTTGTNALGNQLPGVIVFGGASDNLIGGTQSGAANVIAFNVGAGVEVSNDANVAGDADGGTSLRNRISQNSIFSNQGLGIDLSNVANPPDGQTPNDPCDGDNGPNNLQNAPVLGSIVGTTINGSVNSIPNATFTIEFFLDDAGDSSGYGEGQSFLGSISVTTDNNCNASFSFTATVPDGKVVTATATDASGNTSEFSNWLAATSTTVASNHNPSNDGDSVTFTATVTDSGQGTPAGTVTFMDGAVAIGSGTLDASGQATFTTSSLSVGSHSITAVYGGGTNFSPGTSPGITQVVNAVSDLSIGKTASPATVVTGSDVTYTLSVRNNGPSTANSVVVTDMLPSAVTFKSVTPPAGWTCANGNGTVVCNTSSLVNGSTSTIIIVATVNCGDQNGASILNTASVASASNDPQSNNNSATATITASDPPPVISCPSNMTASQDSAYGAIVNYPAPIVTDNCPAVSTSCDHPSGSNFALGSSTVKCTATDSGGNSASCSFTITVGPPPSTVGAKLTGSGSIPIAGGTGTFNIMATAAANGSGNGNVGYQDSVTGTDVTSTIITAIVVTGTHARIFGKATINGSGSYDFVVDVDDFGSPGVGSDRFGIQISNGYVAGPAKLGGGNIKIH